MISKDVINNFQKGMEKLDKELEDYKKAENISVPIYHHYAVAVWIVPPHLKEEGLYIDPKAPEEIVKKYSEVYKQAVLDAAKA